MLDHIEHFRDIHETGWRHWKKKKRSQKLWEEDSNGCHIWLGTVDGSGYGLYGGRPAHRIRYQLVHGEIPRHLAVDHLCRVRRCINVDHLEAVTYGENTRRGIGCKLDKEKVSQIKRLLEMGFSCSLLGRMYGVHVGAIWTIKKGIGWIEIVPCEENKIPFDISKFEKLRYRNTCSKLNREDLGKIVMSYMNGEKRTDLAREFGVCASTIDYAINRRK